MGGGEESRKAPSCRQAEPGTACAGLEGRLGRGAWQWWPAPCRLPTLGRYPCLATIFASCCSRASVSCSACLAASSSSASCWSASQACSWRSATWTHRVSHRRPGSRGRALPLIRREAVDPPPLVSQRRKEGWDVPAGGRPAVLTRSCAWHVCLVSSSGRGRVFGRLFCCLLGTELNGGLWPSE